MAANTGSPAHKIMSTLGSVKTGVILLIIVGVVAAAGTVILQRPITEPEQMAQAYSPQTLRVLDAIGLTDVFHAWWFIILMALFSLSIVCVSIERWPNAWRFYARPYRRPEPHFRAGVRHKREYPILNGANALGAAERAFARMGLKPQRVTDANETSLFAERARISVFAVYIVHASLLLIFAGGIIDGLVGYKGYITLTPGQQINKVDLSNRTQRDIPFTLRCDGTGQENYADGSPKKWWSKLAVLEDGREVLKKEVIVNDPLVYKGIRFYQAGFGRSNDIAALKMTASPQTVSADKEQVKPVPGGETKSFVLQGNEPVAIDANTTVRLVQFIPDYYVQDGQIFRRSNQINDPAVELEVKAKGDAYRVWLFPASHQDHNQSPYHLDITGAEFANFTGLSVSHEPGQWAVWAGCLLMGIGMALAFYTFHTRWWAQVVPDGQGGLTLWVGAAASKQREVFEQRFREVISEVEKELEQSQALAVAAMATAAGK